MEMGRDLCLAILSYDQYKHEKNLSIISYNKKFDFTKEKIKKELVNEIEEKKTFLKTVNSSGKNT